MVALNVERFDAERRKAQALEELDTWDDVIVALNLALTDFAVARDRQAELSRLMDLEEARAVLGTSGGNADTRKAAVLLALHEQCPAYQELLAKSREARLKLSDAEWRAEIARQQCRLLREAVRLRIDDTAA